MSCKSMLYAANTASQTITAGGIVSFGSAIRKFGNNAYMSGGSVMVKGQGYYNIDTNFTITPGATGTMTITLYKDGMAIPGATATIATTAAEAVAVSIPAMIRELCCCENAITATLSAAGTVTNAAIIVEKE